MEPYYFTINSIYALKYFIDSLNVTHIMIHYGNNSAVEAGILTYMVAMLIAVY